MMTQTVKKGFSFVELIAVITLMAILGMGAMKYLGGQIEDSKIKTTKNTLQTVDSIIDNYHLDIGRYPETLADLSRKPYDESAAKKWTQAYFKQALKNPDYMPVDGWGREIQYHLNEKGAPSHYDLYSFGTNGEDAPEDEWIHAE